jgi:anti-sigma B factor antagonist
VRSSVEIVCGTELATVFVLGELDVALAIELRRAIDAAVAAPGEKIVLDLARVDYIDSTGLGALVGASTRAEQHAKKLVLRSPSRAARTLLARTGLASSFDVVLA